MGLYFFFNLIFKSQFPKHLVNFNHTPFAPETFSTLFQLRMVMREEFIDITFFYKLAFPNASEF
jgi:hypothetical protein